MENNNPLAAQTQYNVSYPERDKGNDPFVSPKSPSPFDGQDSLETLSDLIEDLRERNNQ